MSESSKKDKEIFVLKTITLRVPAKILKEESTKEFPLTIDITPATEAMLRLTKGNIAQALDAKAVRAGFDLDLWLEEYYKARLCQQAGLEKAGVQITQEELEAGKTKKGDVITVS